MVKYIGFSVLTYFLQLLQPMQATRSDLDVASTNVIIDFAREMEDSGLKLCGLSVAESNGKVTCFYVRFKTENIIDVNTARRDLVELISQFVAKINSSENVRQFLQDYPVTEKNISCCLFAGRSSELGVLQSVVIAGYENGRCSYFADGPGPKGLPTVISRESYEEAVDKAAEL